MPSPFPGMDPYLEGYLWPDVHHRLATQICRQLAPRLKPRYVARLEITVVEDVSFEAEVGLMYPDVEIVAASQRAALREPAPAWAEADVAQAEAEPEITPPLIIRAPEIRLAAVEVRDAARNELVTCIEIVSPVNKREPGLTGYRQKRDRLRRAGVHLLEIDLIRRGVRLPAPSRVSSAPYLVTLIRAQTHTWELWPIKLQDRLPTVPIPLRAPDPDVPLDLPAALKAIYEEAAYELSIDYSLSPPPPPLSAEETGWLKALKAAREQKPETK
jgi:hypothetical protein